MGNLPQANRRALSVMAFTAPSRAARQRRDVLPGEAFPPLNGNLADIVGDPSSVGMLLR